MIISENTCTSYIRRTLAFGYEIGTKKCDLYTSNYGIPYYLSVNVFFVYIKPGITLMDDFDLQFSSLLVTL